MNYPKSGPRQLGALLTLIFAAGEISAQPNPVTGAGESAAIVLSPFIVDTSKDSGYRATTQISATRLNSPIKELPFFVSVVTPEFIQDTQALSLNDTLRFVAGVQPRIQENFYDTGYTIRGQEVIFSFRDGARMYRPPSSESVERVEVLKGPAALLYGETSPGGAVNFVTKRANLFRTTGSVEVLGSSWSNYRGMVDANVVAVPKVFAARVIASYGDYESFTDFSEGKRLVIAPSLLFQPTEKTRVSLFYEHLKVEDNGRLSNGTFLWNGPTNTGAVAFNGAPGSRIGPHPASSLSDNIFPNSYIEENVDSALLSLEHSFSKGVISRFSISYTDGMIYNINGAGNDFISDIDPGFNVARVVRIVPQRTRNEEILIRKEFVLQFDTPQVRSRLLGGVEYANDKFTIENMRFRNKFRAQFDARSVGGANRTTERDTFDPRTKSYTGWAVPGAAPLSLFKAEPLDITGDIPGSDIGSSAEADRWGYYGTYQAALLDNRLHLLAGARYHEYYNNDVRANRHNFNAYEFTPQAGLSFTPSQPVTFFVGYSESFRPQGGSDSRGQPFDPIQGKGFDAGVKVELLDAKVAGTLSYFDNKVQGLVAIDSTFDTDPTNPGIQPGFFSNAKNRSSGLDLDLIFTTLPHWQTTLGLTVLDSKAEITGAGASAGRRITVRAQNAAPFYATAWTKYSFQGAPLKNLWVGGGFTHVGGGRIPDYGRAYLNGAYTLVDAAVGYRLRVKGQRTWNIQANLKNIMDKEYYVFSNFPGRPREFVVSVKLAF